MLLKWSKGAASWGLALLFDERPNEATVCRVLGRVWYQRGLLFERRAAFNLPRSPGLEVERRNLFGRGTRRFLVKVLYETSLGPATDSWDAPGMFTLNESCLLVERLRV